MFFNHLVSVYHKLLLLQLYKPSFALRLGILSWLILGLWDIALATERVLIGPQSYQEHSQAAKTLLLIQTLVFLFAILMLIVLYLNWRRGQRSNEILEQRVLERTQALEATLQELEASNRFKNRLFSIMAHDLRSPMANLTSILALVAEGTMEEHEALPLLGRLRHQTESLQRSLDNLLHWSQDQLSGQPPRLETVSVHEIIREVYQLYLPVAQQKSVLFTVASTPDCLVSGDLDQIRLIVRNLVNNAIKFTPAGQKVHLSAQVSEGQVILKVEDQGIGMNTGQLQNIFSLGHAQARAGTEGEKGIGIGLELCQDYSTRNGGSLSVTSQRGQGSCFVFTLPHATHKGPPKEGLSET